MRLRINLEDLRQRKLFIATPRYGAQLWGGYADSMDDLRTVMAKWQLDLKIAKVDNDSCVARARNTLADEFLRSDCTHMLFWDGDIRATPDNVFGLLSVADPKSDKDVVCGLYPKKHIRWDKVEAAVKQGVDPEDLKEFVGDMVFNPVGLSGQHDLYSPLEVSECGTGFMLIQRKVFAEFILAYPERAYRVDHIPDQEWSWAFFLEEIDPVSRRLLTEDYNFCRLVRAIGLKVWVCPWMNLSHYGGFEYVGNAGAVSSLIKPAAEAA